MEKISIIVPIYNSFSYLDRCLNSVINQSYYNIEIILINDCSTDDSISIIKKYHDKRIKLINNQKNLGVSLCRNIGIKNSSGKYIAFIDSDDYVERDYIEILYNLIKEDNYDLAAVDYKKIINTKEYNNSNNKKYILNNKELIRKILNYQIEMAVCGKLIKKSLFNNLLFPKDKIFEDIDVMGKILLNVNKAIYLSISKYNYIIRKGSLSFSNYTNKELNRITFSKKFADDIIRKYSDMKTYANIYYINNLLAVSNKLLIENNYKNDIINMTKRVIKDNYFKVIFKLPIKKKIQYTLFIININLYKKLYLIIKKDSVLV